MFIRCPSCAFLVALDEHGRPLPRCPQCARRLRDDTEDAAAAPNAAAPRGAQHLRPQATTPGAGPSSSAAPPEAVPAATEVAKPAREDDDRALLAEAPPTKAEDPQAARHPAPQTAQPPVEAAPVPTGAAIHAPANPEPESNGDTVPAGNAIANAIGVPSAETAPPSADANPGTNRAFDAPVAPAMAAAEPAAPSMPQDPTRPITAATPEPTDAAADTTLPVIEQTHAGAADAGLIAERVQREVPAEAESEAAIAAVPPAAAVAQRVVTQPVAPAGPEGVAGTPSMPEPAASARTPASARPTPSFVRSAQAAAPVDRRRWLHRSAVAALSLLLALQLLLSERARLAADAGWRPLLASLCGVLRCSLPAWREPLAFELLERDVRAHPSLRGVLRVSARIRNGARWPQAWPVLQLTFSDVHGRNVAARLFQPREYLGGAPAQSVLGRGQVAGISMDVIEPGTQAVAFTFDFK